MKIEVFISECKKLQHRFGKDKITKKLLNEIWELVKHKDDDYIVFRCSALMQLGISHTFTTDDFLLTQDASNEVEKSEVSTPKRGKSGWQPDYVHTKTEFQPGSLEKYLKETGASTALEAMEMILTKHRQKA